MLIVAVALVMWLMALVLMMGLCSAAAAGDRRMAAEIEQPSEKGQTLFVDMP